MRARENSLLLASAGGQREGTYDLFFFETPRGRWGRDGERGGEREREREGEGERGRGRGRDKQKQRVREKREGGEGEGWVFFWGGGFKNVKNSLCGR